MRTRAPSRWFGLTIAATTAFSGNAAAIIIPLARGADATFVVTVNNPTSNDIPRAYFETLQPVSWVWSGYLVEAMNSPLCSIGGGNLYFPLNSVQFSVGPISAHGSVPCSIHVHRNDSSLYALGLGFQKANPPSEATLGDPVWIVGPLADLSIDTRQVKPIPLPSERVGFVEVSVTNSGPLDVQHGDFGYCQDTASAPFVLDNEVPNGCGAAYFGPFCFSTGGPSVQFGVGALAAGQSKSCVLRVTANDPLNAPIAFPLFLVGDLQSPSGEYPTDPDPGNDMTELTLSSRAPEPVPLGNVNWILVAGLVSLVVGRRSAQTLHELA
jgi:hypothetical protein